MAELPDAPGPNSLCEQCGAAFHCGVRDEEPCWCAIGFEHVLSGEAGRSCLCPDCLRARIAARSREAT